jgi:hypothetical protein
LRALVVGDELLVELARADGGSLRIAAAGSAIGDGDHGGVGCIPASERRIVQWTIDVRRRNVVGPRRDASR